MPEDIDWTDLVPQKEDLTPARKAELARSARRLREREEERESKLETWEGIPTGYTLSSKVPIAVVESWRERIKCGDTYAIIAREHKLPTLLVKVACLKNPAT